MKVDGFSFELPGALIAQVPADRRDASRLMILNRSTGAVAHRTFSDFVSELAENDLLVLNDTKVLPTRLRGTKPTGGRIEVLLVERLGEAPGGSRWRALLTGSKSVRPGMTIAIAPGLTAIPEERVGDVWTITLLHPDRDAEHAIDAAGIMPLPPYIRREESDPRESLDRLRYQTVYARHAGAAAAPTAGLHLTEELLAAARARGVELAFVTLHVGLGTFAPIRESEVEEHRIHEEPYTIPDATVGAVRRTKSRGGRVVAIGTTVARALETSVNDDGILVAGAGRSSLFIYPGFRFRAVDALVTNFHLPQSTLLMLVCAFAGTDAVLAAYATAVQEKYRFFSYGDAMFVRP